MNKNFNIILIAVIAVLIAAILAFNYGYRLGERRGYVMGVQKCLEGMEENHQIQKKYFH
jgi:hypothetical protein